MDRITRIVAQDLKVLKRQVCNIQAHIPCFFYI